MKFQRIFGKSNYSDKMSVGVELNSEGKIDITCNWTIPETREEADKLAKDYALMIISAYKKEVMPYVQTTIANHGVKTHSEKFSSLILIYINTILNPAENKDDDSPVIQPDEAFQVRGGE